MAAPAASGSRLIGTELGMAMPPSRRARRCAAAGSPPYPTSASASSSSPTVRASAPRPHALPRWLIIRRRSRSMLRAAGSRARYSPPPSSTARDGFIGLDGVFRFEANGVAERAMEVREVDAGTFLTASPAPAKFNP